MTYYYLIASLPGLTLGESPALSGADFLARCREQLAPGDFAELEAVLAGGGSGSFAESWSPFETHMRNTVARARAHRLQADPARWLREGERWENLVLETVDEAFARATPLEREFALDHCRWQRLDELAVGHAFDLDTVLIYALRLQRCERWAGLDAARGRSRLDSFLEQGRAAS